jgi:hypothetical protein
MESLSYIPGFKADDPGPLSRFLPPLEQGTIAGWLTQHVEPSSWLLDPFGFSPRLVVEAARAGYRVLVTVNNPVTRFLLEVAADPPSEADFKAALAELAASRRGEERLEPHLRALYQTRCENCGHENPAHAFLWRKGEDVPFGRIYKCSQCGDEGERAVAQEDIDRARRIAAADGLHRSRAFERVVALDDEDRPHVQEAIQHYLPRPLYALNTIINRRDSLTLTPERERALAAMILVACDAGNTLWSYPSERARPKALNTPTQFRENNVWMMLEAGLEQWSETGAPVPCVAWPKRIPGDGGGICVYEGRLRNLAHEVRQEIPIKAVIGSVPRPNQAFWTLSALWAGWLWGHSAVEPFKVALQRRRYDWAWNATALHAAFAHLFDLLALGTPFFGLLPEAEAPFLSSALTAISAAGFDLKGFALRTEHDPVQFVWERGEHLRREPGPLEPFRVRTALEEHLVQRGEPASYLHLHAAALQVLAESHSLRQNDGGFDEALRGISTLIESSLKDEPRFIHYSTGENVGSGLWGLLKTDPSESLADRVEVAAVNFLQQGPDRIYLEIEEELYGRFPGLITPSKGMIYAILNSYASREGGSWKLRLEDTAAARQEDLKTVGALIEAVGRRLGYKTSRQEKWLVWEENGTAARVFNVLASALISRAIAGNPHPPERSVLVAPGGRAGLIAYKQQRDPSLAGRMQPYRVTKYRLWRALSKMPILTRDSFEEQLSSDPIEQARGQMMMF